MKIAKTIDAYRQLRDQLTGTVAFVPTLGAMHHGHEALLRRAKAHADHLVVSIFLNPTQFGPNEDLDSYPTNLDGDLALCEKNGAEIVFLPTVNELYPDAARLKQKGYTAGQLTQVLVNDLPNHLCGLSRPGHFLGVTTVVTKLLHIMEPHVAVFGEKDFQQLAILRRMVSDLNMRVKILSQPTVRENDGLAVSSRNLRLTPEERNKAPKISRSLAKAWKEYQNGATPKQLVASIHDELHNDFSIDYIECIDSETLESLSQWEDGKQPMVAIAATIGSVRLIDNLQLTQPLPTELQS